MGAMKRPLLSIGIMITALFFAGCSKKSFDTLFAEAQASYNAANYVEAIDNVSGRTLWKSEEFGALFSEEPKRVGDDRFPVPLAGEVRAADLIVSIDDRTLVLVERGGRGAAFDAEDGRRGSERGGGEDS
jgi:hypothetical protein